MAYEIEERKVAGVVKEASLALSGKDFNHGEVLVGLAEMLGRLIVEVADTHIQMTEMVKVVEDHINRTITIGAHATGKSGIARA